MMNTVIRKLTAIGIFLVLLTGCDYFQQNAYVTEIPWSLTGKWMIADIHTHTRFSDGSYTVAELVDHATEQGCDVLAITDHSDLSQQAATPEYFRSIEQARQLHPELVLFAGMEWNVPSYKGREHVTMLVKPEIEQALLEEFKRRFEPAGATDDDALYWLTTHLSSEADAVLFYNHPSRKDNDVEENLTDYINWSWGNTLFAGFEGGPGHQKARSVGAYSHALKPIDRWDPVVDTIGGVWDTLLDGGTNVWAALASSDFHNDHLDYLPCQFARTHLQVPEKNPRGVLQALRAGSFWAGHGKVLDALTVLLSVEGLGLPLTPGEAARIKTTAPIRLSVAMERNPENGLGPLVIEVIGNGRNGIPELLESKTLQGGEQMAAWDFSGLKTGGDRKSIYFRVRIRKIVADAPDLMAYSNPIRLFLN